MRPDDLKEGSLKALLVLVLLVANIVVASPEKSAPSRTPGAVRDLRPVPRQNVR